jgi:N-acetylmuramoyl-L-alanine amidase
MLRVIMVFAPPVTRRLLLRRFAAGTPVFGTFLLPPALHGAMAASTAGHGAIPTNARPRHKDTRPHDGGGAKPPPPLVMLDPGHGGKDPGAIGVSGTYEKQVSLATAL